MMPTPLFFCTNWIKRTTMPSTAPKTSFWSNCVLFGAVAGSVIGCLWNSVHSPENELLEQLCAFRGCGKICHWLLVEFRPQPRKRAFGAIVCFSGLWQDLSSAACGIPSTAPKTSSWSNCVLFGAVVDLSLAACGIPSTTPKRPFGAILCFSGLWWDLSLAAFGIPSTAPKTSFWSNRVLFRAVVGSVIGCLWNSVHSPENELLEQLCAFRGCGGICHWLLVEFRPQPRTRAFGAIVCFSGLWQDLSSAACGIPSTAPKTSFWSNYLLFGAVAGSVIGCLWNSVHSPENELLEQLCPFRGCGEICHWLLVEFRPQPRKQAFAAIVCFSGLWSDLSSAACGIPSTAPKTIFWSNNCNCVLFGAVARSVIGCLWNSVHSPENELLEQLCAFRSCGRICHWLLVEFRPQPRKRAFGAIVCFSGLWSDLSLAACGIPATAPKTSFWTNSLLFGAVVGSVIGCLWNSVHSPENELLEQLCAFRGCGRICHWLLVEFRPQPRKRAFAAIVCFSGLW